jgi:hypothetical protein
MGVKYYKSYILGLQVLGVKGYILLELYYRL